MSTRHDPTDPVHMAPEQRLAEVAAILARGVLRLRNRSALPATAAPADPSQNSFKSGEIGLELCPEMRLDGHGS